MTWLNILFLLVSLMFSGLSGAAPCAPNLPERLIPQAGEKGIAMFPQEIIKDEYQNPQFMAAKGFDHLVGMLNAVTVYSCERNQSATIEIQKFEVIRFKPEGGFVTEASFSGDGTGTIRFDGGQWKRSPEWFISGQPVIQKSVIRNTGGTLAIDLKSIPENIVHLWTGPRTKAMPGARYGILLVARVSGDARLQLAMDYWKGESSPYNGWSEGCRQSNNCEAWLSDWIGDTKGQFVQVVVPKSFSTARP